MGIDFRWNAVTLALLITACMPIDQAESQTGVKRIVREEHSTTHWSLLIGVNDYIHIADLEYCANDVLQLQQRLTENGFLTRNQFCLHSGASDSRLLPLHSNIEKHLDLLLGRLNESGTSLVAPGLVSDGDLVVIAFSGHGLDLDGKSYLCPMEADLGDPDSLISVESIYRRLAQSRASFKLMLVDACRNDPGIGGEKSTVAKSKSAGLASALEDPPKGIMVLSSCARGQVSIEDPDLGHGVFLNFVTEGLDGTADVEEGNKDGQVSLLELYRYASRKTKYHVAATRRLPQTPALRGEMVGDFEFGTNRLAMADQLWLAGDQAGAIRSVKQTLDDDPAFKRAYCFLGYYHRQQGNLDEALQDYNQALAVDPQYAAAFFNRAVVWNMKQMNSSALQDCNEAIRFDPKHVLAMTLRGTVRRKMGDTEGAIDDFSNALQIDPNHDDALYERATLYGAMQNHDAAISDFSDAIRLKPTNFMYYSMRGHNWLAKQRFERAIEDYDQALKLNPTYSFSLRGRAEAKMALRMYDDALADLTQVITRYPTMPSSYSDRAKVWRALGNTSMAQRDEKTYRDLTARK